MPLTIDALDLKSGSVVTLLGGDERFGLLWSMASALRERGRHVVICGTGPMPVVAVDHAEEHVMLNRRVTRPVLNWPSKRGASILVTGPAVRPRQPFPGITPSQILALRDLPDTDVLLVTADDARLPIDIHGTVPPSTTHVLFSLDADAFNMVLAPEQQRMLQRYAINATTFDHKLYTAVLNTPHGPLRSLPGRAEAHLFLQGDDSQTPVAQDLLNIQHIRSVILASAPEQPAQWIRRVAVIVNTAVPGAVLPDGQLQALSTYGDTTLLGNALETAMHTWARHVVLVMNEPLSMARRGMPLGIHQVFTDRGEHGNGVAQALRSLPSNVEAVVMLPVDKPRLAAEHLNALIDVWYRTGSPLVAPRYKGERRHPMLFSRRFFDDLAEADSHDEVFDAHRHFATWVKWDEDFAPHTYVPPSKQ